MKLTAATEKFIVHWGEMGTRWGVNRTVAQIHALLYIAGRPMQAEEISETLGVARSNVSNSLRELQGWRIVNIVHVLGDRRDHFETTQDVWSLFQIIMDERKKREIDPTLAMLADCVAQAREEGDAAVVRRLEELDGFINAMSLWYAQIRRLPPSGWRQLSRMGGSVLKILGVKN